MATVSPETRQVHFAVSVDWEEEERRSVARAEKKRKKKESIAMAEAQKELRIQGIMLVISDKQNWHDLTTLCFKEEGEFVQLAVWRLVLGRGKCNSTTLARYLDRFAKMDHTSLGTMNRDQIVALETLNVRPEFTDLFSRKIAAATVVTSGSEAESENVQRDSIGRSRRERRRGWRQREANAAARTGEENSNPGGASVIPE